MRTSVTLAELTTPGKPAPGWVPAPTKNKVIDFRDLGFESGNRLTEKTKAQ